MIKRKEFYVIKIKKLNVYNFKELMVGVLDGFFMYIDFVYLFIRSDLCVDYC